MDTSKVCIHRMHKLREMMIVCLRIDVLNILFKMLACRGCVKSDGRVGVEVASNCKYERWKNNEMTEKLLDEKLLAEKVLARRESRKK